MVSAHDVHEDSAAVILTAASAIKGFHRPGTTAVREAHEVLPTVTNPDLRGTRLRLVTTSRTFHASNHRTWSSVAEYNAS